MSNLEFFFILCVLSDHGNKFKFPVCQFLRLYILYQLMTQVMSSNKALFPLKINEHCTFYKCIHPSIKSAFIKNCLMNVNTVMTGGLGTCSKEFLSPLFQLLSHKSDKIKKCKLVALPPQRELLLLLLLSSSSSPLCRVFILIFLRHTMSLGNTVLQLFCCYYSWCLYR